MSICTDSARRIVETVTVAPSAVKPRRRDVTSSRPAPGDGRRPLIVVITSESSALSNTNNDRGLSAQPATTTAGSASAGSPTAGANPARYPPINSGCSAGTQPTRSNASAYRWMYSTTSAVFPTPPIPATAVTATDPAANRPCISPSSASRPTKCANRAGTCPITGRSGGNTGAVGDTDPSVGSAPGKGGSASGGPGLKPAASTTRSWAVSRSTPNRSTAAIEPNNPGGSQSSTRNTKSFRSRPSGSIRTAAYHSTDPNLESR